MAVMDFSVCTANTQKAQIRKDKQQSKYIDRKKGNRKRTRQKKNAQKTGKKKAEENHKKTRMLNNAGNNAFMVLTQHGDAFVMLRSDPLMRAVFKDVSFEPSIRGYCNKNKL